jgi:hypothetical protein
MIVPEEMRQWQVLNAVALVPIDSETFDLYTLFP